MQRNNLFNFIIFLLFCTSAYSQKIYYSDNSNNPIIGTTKIYIIENSYCQVIDSIITNENAYSFCVSENDSLLFTMEFVLFPEENGGRPGGFSLYKYDTKGNFIEDVVIEYKTNHYVENIIYKNADTLLVTGGLGYTIIDLKNNNFNHITTSTLGIYPYDIAVINDQLYALNIFTQNIVNLDFDQNTLDQNPVWNYLPNGGDIAATNISALGSCSQPQDFIISYRFRENGKNFREIHYVSSPDFITNISCIRGPTSNVNGVVRAIPYPLILDLDSSTDYCESNDTIISLTLCSDNQINLDGLHPYIEEYDDHIDSITINIVDGPPSVTLDYNLGMLDENIVNNKSLVLSNTGSSTIQDFTDAITSLSIENIPDNSASRIEIEFQLFSYIRQSLPATVVIELTQEDTYAGRDTSLIFCPDATVIDLNDYIDVAASIGTWPMGSSYDPETSTSENIPYVVEGLICPNDTAIYSVELYPDALSQSELISFCEGDSVLYRGVYYSQDVDLLDTVPSVLSGCDSLYQMVEIRNSDAPLLLRIDTTICDGTFIDFGGQQVNAAGTYTDTLSNVKACDSLISTLTVVVESPIVAIEIDTVLCNGQSLLVDNLLIEKDTILQQVVPNINGCDSIQYNVNAMFISPIEITIDTLLCEGEILTIEEQSYTESTSDQLYIKDAAGCDSILLNVLINYEERLQLPDQEFEVMRSTPTQIGVVYDEEYQSVMWDSEEGLSCIDCLDPIVELEEDAFYQLRIIHENKCDELIDIYVIVVEDIVNSESDFYLPNVIDVRSSNNNRFYMQTAQDEMITYSLSVYDRWGNQVFLSESILSNDANNGWDGQDQNGIEISQGVYVYKIVTQDGEVISGDILVLR